MSASRRGIDDQVARGIAKNFLLRKRPLEQRIDGFDPIDLRARDVRLAVTKFFSSIVSARR